MSSGLTDAGPMPARVTWLLVGAITVAGLVVRAMPVGLSDFPVNDGGLFLAMTRAIQDAGWSLPATVSWNGSDLPFTSPPLAFYKVGLLHSVFGLDMYGIFRWFPLLTSALIVPAVYLMAGAVLRSEIGGLVAALAYALTPSSYVWLIQGGGVTRSPGLLLAVLTLWQVVLLVRAPTSRRAVAVGVLAGLTALIHPGAAVFAALSAVLIGTFEGRSGRSALYGLAAGVIALAIVAPWLGTVVSRHGLEALTDVPSNGPDLSFAILTVFSARFTGLPFFDPLAVAGLAMAVLCVVQRRLLLPLWLLLANAMSLQYAMLPFGLLIGTAVLELVARWRVHIAGGAAPLVRRVPAIGVVLLAAFLALEGVMSGLAVFDPGMPVHALSPERRAAMSWVATELEPEARVALITGSFWTRDPDSEWFPLLAQRTSVATVQGSEWLGAIAFNERFRAHHTLQVCVHEASVSCVHDWLAERPAEFLYLPTGHLHGPNSPPDCCTELRRRLVADPGFDVVYEGPGATILKVVLPPVAPGQGSWITVAPGPS